MRTKRISLNNCPPRACSRKETVNNSRAKENLDNIVLIDVDSDDLDDIEVVNVSESQQQKLPSDSSGMRRDFPYEEVINIPDDDSYCDNPGVGLSGGNELDSDATSSKRSCPSDSTSKSVDTDADDCCVVLEEDSPVKSSNSKEHPAGEAPSRNRYGFFSDSESDQYDRESSDIELMDEDSYRKLREDWTKASLRKKHHWSHIDQVWTSAFHDDVRTEPGVRNASKRNSKDHDKIYYSSKEKGKENMYDGDDCCRHVHSDTSGVGNQQNSDFNRENTPGLSSGSTENACNVNNVEGRQWWHCNTVNKQREEGGKHVKTCLWDKYKNKILEDFYQKIPPSAMNVHTDNKMQVSHEGCASHETQLPVGSNTGSVECRQDSYRQSHSEKNPSCIGSFSRESFSDRADQKEQADFCVEPSMKNPILSGEIHTDDGRIDEIGSVSGEPQSRDKSEASHELKGTVEGTSSVKEHGSCGQLVCNREGCGEANLLHEDHSREPPSDRDIINERERIKETDEYKRAVEEEWASRQRQLQIQAEEAQRLRRKRKAENERLLDMERRQKQRLEEIRETQKKDEENMNLKEQLRAEIRKELYRLELTCFDMASLLRGLGIPVGGSSHPLSQEVHAAYKRALLRFHPDRTSRNDIRQQVEAEEKFKLISRMKEKFLLTSCY